MITFNINPKKQKTLEQKMTELKIFGCRGSISYDSLENKIFGGNTTSYSLRTPDNYLFLLDAGSGLLEAQNEVYKNMPRGIYLFLSHFHYLL